MPLPARAAAARAEAAAAAARGYYLVKLLEMAAFALTNSFIRCIAFTNVCRSGENLKEIILRTISYLNMMSMMKWQRRPKRSTNTHTHT